MLVSLKTCALCQKPLAVRYPTIPGDVPRYVCGIHVPNTKLSHYYVEVNGQVYTQIIHIPPYTLINASTNDRTWVYPYSPGSSHVTGNKLIVSLPRIPIIEPDKLLEKIKIFVLFS